MKATADRKKALGVFSIGLMTAAAVVTSLRGMPLLAKEEMTMFAYLAFTVIFYLVPASLVSAELGGAFADKKGGIYAWVGKAFGIRWGFLAIWLQWIQNVVWYPVTLTFGAVAFAYTFGHPDLAKNGIYVGLFCIVVYWLATVVVLQGVEVFAKISTWTFIIGTVLPGICLLLLCGYWITSGHPIGWQHLTDATVSAHRTCALLAGNPRIGDGRVSRRDRAAVRWRGGAGGARHGDEESEHRISARYWTGCDCLFASLCYRIRADRCDIAVRQDFTAIRRLRNLQSGDY